MFNGPDFDKQALSFYQSFCEDHSSGPLQDAWDQYQELHGDIEINSPPEKLVIGAISHTLKVMAGYGVEFNPNV
jgi:hypothetical protein